MSTTSAAEAVARRIEARLRSAISSMPFGGIVHFLEDLANYLESLRDVLEEHVKEHDAMAAELRDRKDDDRALLRILVRLRLAKET